MLTVAECSQFIVNASSTIHKSGNFSENKKFSDCCLDQTSSSSRFSSENVTSGEILLWICEEQLACYVMQAPHCSTCTSPAYALCYAIWDVLCPWRCSTLSPSMGTGMCSWWLQRAAKLFYTHDEIRHVLMHLVQVGGGAFRGS